MQRSLFNPSDSRLRILPGMKKDILLLSKKQMNGKKYVLM
jgi:hypothetical protein